MVQLRDDASLEDVVNEIIIIEVMLDTLEPDDGNCDEEHAYHKQYLAKLREMQDSHTGGSLNTLQRQASGNSIHGLVPKLAALPISDKTSTIEEVVIWQGGDVHLLVGQETGKVKRFPVSSIIILAPRKNSE